MLPDYHLMTFLLQQREGLREALRSGDSAAALGAVRSDSRFRSEEHATVFATLIGELVQYIADAGRAELAEATEPRTTLLFAAYRRDGRTGGYATSVRQELETYNDECLDDLLSALLATGLAADGCSRGRDEDEEPAARDLVQVNGGRSRIEPGRELPGGIEPRSSRPQPPDRRFEQPGDFQDARLFNELMRLLDRAQVLRQKGKARRANSLFNKAEAMQLAHYEETGRWLTRVPPTKPGFYRDPTGCYMLRYWQGAHWTEQVSDGSGAVHVDPDFPTDADHHEWLDQLARWERGGPDEGASR